MASREDIADRKLSLGLFLGIAAVVVVGGGLLFWMIGPAFMAAVEPGIGLRDAALIAFGVSLVTIVIMALAAGDGLIGELQFMLLAFAGFFIVCWVMVAWIF